MFKFEVGSVYYARSACNHDCVFLMKVLSRTDKSVKAEFSGEGVKRAMIRVSDRVGHALALLHGASVPGGAALF